MTWNMYGKCHGYTRVLPPVIKHSNWKSPVRSVSEGLNGKTLTVNLRSLSIATFDDRRVYHISMCLTAWYIMISSCHTA